MREEPVLRLAMEVALLASRDQPYLVALERGVSSVFGIDTGIGLITWERNNAPGAARGDALVIGERTITQRQIADAAAVAPRHPAYRAVWQIGTTYPVRTSDHVRLREFWPTDVWRAQHSHCDGHYPIGFTVSASPGEVSFIGMHRSDHDFSDEEVCAMAAIQTLLVPALQFRSRLNAAAERLMSCSAEPDRAVKGYCPTRREAEVLSLLTLGWTNSRIGRQLGISERTVRKHLEAVYDKACIPGRAAAAAWWQASQDSAPRIPARRPPAVDG